MSPFRFQVQPNRWSCLPTSLAMVLKVRVRVIFELLGHDGSEILWPDLPEPQKRRSFSLQEMVYVADKFNRKLVCHDKQWCNTPDGVNITNFDPPDNYFQDQMQKHDGIITGVTTQGMRHAVAWVLGRVIDPTTGIEYPYFHGQEEHFLACCR